MERTSATTPLSLMSASQARPRSAFLHSENTKRGFPGSPERKSVCGKSPERKVAGAALVLGCLSVALVLGCLSVALVLGCLSGLFILHL
jgi:hypothetical protein